MADLRDIFEDNRGDDWELQPVREKSFFYWSDVPVAIVRVFNDTLTDISKPERDLLRSHHGDLQGSRSDSLEADPTINQKGHAVSGPRGALKGHLFEHGALVDGDQSMGVGSPRCLSVVEDTAQGDQLRPGRSGKGD
jgi:hypothetical protein